MMWICVMCAPPCLMRTAGETPQCLNTHLHKTTAEFVHVVHIKKKWVVDI